jgi:periplasmic divalent cation tolerance protein
MDDIRFIYITATDTDEAQRIGRALVEQRLAACANVLPGMRSIYRWQGVICEDSEAVLMVKTVAGHVDALISKVKELHSYDCPCIVVLPITGGSEAYLNWLRNSVES